MTNERRNKNENLDAADFLGGRYLVKEQISSPVVATITEVWAERFAYSQKTKLVVSFRELPKPLILNTENTAWLAQHFGTTKTIHWRGPVTIYVNPHVTYGGKVVGGIRFKQANPQSPTMAYQPTEQIGYPNGTHPEIPSRKLEVDGI